MSAGICGKKFGKRLNMICKRHPGHVGQHAIRRTIWEMRKDMGLHK